MKIVKKILVLESNDTYQLSGKTGSVWRVGATYIGWFIGYVEERGNIYFFATNIESTRSESNGVKAKEITREVLQSLELIP
jgi:beta-lactamase class D